MKQKISIGIIVFGITSSCVVYAEGSENFSVGLFKGGNKAPQPTPNLVENSTIQTPTEPVEVTKPSEELITDLSSNKNDSTVFSKVKDSLQQGFTGNSEVKKQLDEELKNIEHIEYRSNLNGLIVGNKTFIAPKSDAIKKGESSFFKKMNLPNQQITMEDILGAAVEWNPEVKLAKSNVRLNEIAVRSAQSAYYPKVSMQLETGIEKDQYGDEPFTTDAVLRVSQLVYDFGRTKNNVEFAKANVAKEEKSFKSKIDELIYNTINAYLQVVRYRYMVQISEDQVKGIEVLNNIAKRRTELGASAYSDYSQSQDSLAEAVSQVYDNRSQLRKWVATLNSITNQDYGDKVVLDFNVQGLDNACNGIDVQQMQSPNIEVAEAQVKIAEAQLRVANSNLYPTISLVPSYSYEIYNDQDYNYDRAKGRPGIALNVNVPIYQGGELTSKRNEAQQALISAKYNVQNELYKSRESLLESSGQINNILKSLESKFYKEDYTKKTRDLYKLQFIELGNRSFLDLLTAERSIYNNQMNIVNSYYNIDTLSLECMYYTGNLQNMLPSKYHFNNAIDVGQ